jgi:flagellar protein FliO/FliZ
MPDLTGILTAVAALAAVIGLVIILGRFARAGGIAPRTGRDLAVREVIALDSRRRLHLIRCNGQDVLLMTGGAHDVVVGWMPRPEAIPTSESEVKP